MNRELLEKQFAKNQIKQRKGNFGNVIDYVDIQLVIKRLNDSFEHNWNFEIIDNKILDEEVIITGKLTANNITKMQFGTNQITRNTKTGKAISIGDDLKAAASDCLKKCASMFGVALHIYGDSDISQPPADEKKEPPADEKKEQPAEQPPADEKKESLQEQAKRKAKETLLKQSARAYFATLKDTYPDFDEQARHQWQLEITGKESTKDWNQDDFRKAFDIMNEEEIRQNMTIFPELNPKNIANAKKYVDGHSQAPITEAQKTYIKKLLKYKGYAIPEGLEHWTRGYCSLAIDYIKGDIQDADKLINATNNSPELSQGLKANALVKTLSEQIPVKAEDIIAYYTARNIRYSESLIDLIIKDVSVLVEDKGKHRDFTQAVREFLLWRMRTPEANEIINALTLCKDKDYRIAELFIIKHQATRLFDIEKDKLENWKETLEQTLIDMEIDHKFIINVLESIAV